MKRLLLGIMILSICVSMLSACERKSAKESASSGVDAISSATPGVRSAVLYSAHAGWQNPACFSCHGDPHNGAFILSECVSCHGSNGAPLRPFGHANTDCESCHPGLHPGLDFLSPRDCRACHGYHGQP